jgi:hypothetical protein
LKVPLPRTLSAIGTKHKTVRKDGWRILTPRHEPEATLEGNLTFALKHEGLDLAVLKRLFLAAGADEIAALVRALPTGGYARRIWFLYGAQLDNGDERCILIEGGERTAEIVYLGHGAPSSVHTHTADEDATPRRLRPIASSPARPLRERAAPG